MAAARTPVDWAQRLANASPQAMAWYIAYVMKYGEAVGSQLPLHPGGACCASSYADSP